MSSLFCVCDRHYLSVSQLHGELKMDILFLIPQFPRFYETKEECTVATSVAKAMANRQTEQWSYIAGEIFYKNFIIFQNWIVLYLSRPTRTHPVDILFL